MTIAGLHLKVTRNLGDYNSDTVQIDINEIDVDGDYMEEVRKVIKFVEDASEIVVEAVAQQLSNTAGINVTNMSEWMKGMGAKLNSTIQEVKRHKSEIELLNKNE